MCCLAVALLLVWQLPYFRLNSIVTTELRSISREELIDASGLSVGQHLFAGLGGSLEQITQLRYAEVEARLLKEFPNIKSVTARLVFPGQINLSIVERVEVAYIQIPDGCVMIDKEGVALKILSDPPADIPVISGVSVVSMNLGQPIEVDVPAAKNSAISLMGAIIDADKDNRTDLLLLGQIKKILPIGSNDLFLTVVLPNTGEEISVAAETGPEQTEKMLWLRFALAQGVFDGHGHGVLDLTGSRHIFSPD